MGGRTHPEVGPRVRSGTYISSDAAGGGTTKLLPWHRSYTVVSPGAKPISPNAKKNSQKRPQNAQNLGSLYSC